MDLIDRVLQTLNADSDALAEHRLRICKNASALGAALMLPFVLIHLLHGGWLMAGVNALGGTVLALSARALRQGRPAPVPFPLLAAMLVVAVCVSVQRQGVLGLLWAYPALFVCYFILTRRLATLLGAALVIGVTAIGAAVLEPGLAVRVGLSLVFVKLMINGVLNVIGDLQQALLAQTLTDPLTGAFNRRHLDAQLGQRVASAATTAATEALLVIDIDHFKRINDSHGHEVGDAVLRQVVNAVQARKRRNDLLFRLGGEEFVLLLPGATLAQAQQIAEDLCQRLAQAELLPGEPVTVSIGVSALQPGQTAEAWVKRADAALYQAKRGGRNRVVLAEAA